MHHRALALLATILLSSFGGAAQSQEETFEESTSVLVVEVPVRVIRNGRPVEGLTAADFQLFERGKPVESFGLDVLDFSPEGPAVADPAAALEHHPWYQGRTYLFVYDFPLNYNRRMLYGVSEGVREMLQYRFGPKDRVAIALFRGHPELIYLLDYSNDRDEILAALDVVDELLRGDFYTARDLLAVLRAKTVEIDSRRAFATGWGREPVLARRARRFMQVNEIPSDRLTQETLALFDYRYVSERKLILNFTRALVGVTETTHDLPGQKHLILFSSGWPDILLFGSRNNVSTLNVVRKIIRSFRQENWALQGVNTGLRWSNEHSAVLSHLAYDTGGEVFSSSNNVAELLDDMFQRTEKVYLLSFQPSELKHDGRYHRIKVKVAGDTFFTQVIYRPGYRAPQSNR